MKIGLVGFPGCGKSSVFNALTGLRQHTGNWPGKTVVRAEGVFGHDGQRVKVVDLPGTYSLQAGLEPARRQELLALAQVQVDTAIEFRQVEGMQRLTDIEHDIVGGINNVVDRAYIDGQQTLFEPIRTFPDGQVLDADAGVAWACYRVFYDYFYREIFIFYLKAVYGRPC